MKLENFSYDPQNVFARIIRKELPCVFILETPYTLVFPDKFPKAPVHMLIIPKGKYVCPSHFGAQAKKEEIEDFFRVIGALPKQLNISSGFRLMSHEGIDGGQEIPHFHMHFLAGVSVKN
jgi:histidine triad (HIT) family protein